MTKTPSVFHSFKKTTSHSGIDTHFALTVNCRWHNISIVISISTAVTASNITSNSRFIFQIITTGFVSNYKIIGIPVLLECKRADKLKNTTGINVIYLRHVAIK
jgi:hypothetical protein